MESNCHRNVYTMTSRYHIMIMHEGVLQCWGAQLQFLSLIMSPQWPKPFPWVFRYSILYSLWVFILSNNSGICLATNNRPCRKQVYMHIDENCLQFCLLPGVFPLHFFYHMFVFDHNSKRDSHRSGDVKMGSCIGR